MSRRLFAAVVLVLFGLLAGGVHAQNAVLPDGIERDASSWLQGLTSFINKNGSKPICAFLDYLIQLPYRFKTRINVKRVKNIRPRALIVSVQNMRWR